MTIAKTGNKIVDAQARKGQADARKEAAKSKAAAKKSARSGSRGKVMGKIVAGRAASKRKSKGIVGAKQKSGKGFKGLLSYALDKEDSKLLVSNCGHDKASILKDMRACANLRPNKLEPVGHASFSLPPSTKISEGDWLKAIDIAREELGLDDSYSYAAVRHSDRDHDHVHLIFSKVSDTGEIYNDYRFGLRLAHTEAIIEQRLNLPLVPIPPRAAPPRLDPKDTQQLKDGLTKTLVTAAVHRAKQNHPTPEQFAKKLAASGIVATPNIASTGKMSGYSFLHSDSGMAFAGSKVSAKWTDLQKSLTLPDAWTPEITPEVITESVQEIAPVAAEPAQEIALPTEAEPAATAQEIAQAETTTTTESESPNADNHIEGFTEFEAGQIPIAIRRRGVRRLLASQLVNNGERSVMPLQNEVRGDVAVADKTGGSDPLLRRNRAADEEVAAARAAAEKKQALAYYEQQEAAKKQAATDGSKKQLMEEALAKLKEANKPKLTWADVEKHRAELARMTPEQRAELHRQNQVPLPSPK